MTNHDELAEALGAFALNALERDEAELVERHLAVCPRCRVEVEQHREVAGLLGFIGQEAPPGLWDRIVASLQSPPPALRLELVGSSRSPGSRGPGGRPGRSAAGRARRGDVSWRAVALLGAAAAAVVALLSAQVVRLDDRTGALKAEVAALAGPTPSRVMVEQALAQPGAHHVELRGSGAPTTLLEAVVLPDGAGYVYNSHLAPLPADRTYQLWGVRLRESVSYGLLGPSPAVVAFHAGSGVQALSVTAEAAGGVVRSDNPPVAVGKLQS
ncbi:MAG: anti-sigma factor domain-containing protein [Acidimicrobiales bacterium]